MTTSNLTAGAHAPAPHDIVASATRPVDGRGYLDWGAIIAGAVVAAALSFVLLSFGSALGFGIASPWPDSGISALGFAVAAAVWLLATQVASFGAGGYLAGRLRRRVGDAKPAEIDLRDGSHGLVVWAIGTLVGAVLLASGLAGAARTAADAAGGTVAAVADAAPDVDASYLADSLLRDGSGEGARPDQATRDAIGRIVERVLATGALSEADLEQLTTTVASAAGLEPQEAEVRVAALQERIAELRETALAAADTARRWGGIAAFLVAATLLVSAAAAYLAASMGGRHRDSGMAIPRWVAD
jgi:hypothetical protein